MNKGFKFYLVIWTTIVVLFNTIAFVTPAKIAGMSKYTGSFWCGYIFVMLALVGQLSITWYATMEENATRTFYRIPLISISVSGMIAIAASGILCMAIPVVPAWLSVIVSLLAFGISLMAVATTEATVSFAEKVDKKVRIDTFFMRALATDIDDICRRSANDEIASEVGKVLDAVKYSDTLSHEALAEVETKITLKVKELADTVAEGNLAHVKSLSEDIQVLLNERNKKCALLKKY